ncbi:MAG: hypothetical protein NTZ46_03405, partial [Verrucomicrobia bacterium]|nr:hypothetical protein [Verrucomicrobiota bacterium]
MAKETPAQATASADPHGGAMPAMAPPNHPSMGGGMAAQPAMGGTAAPEVNIGTAPEDWKMKPPTSMRLASFEVQAEKDAVADISLILLNGAAGGVLSNVNRWQSQLGQPELTEAELAQKAQRVDSPLGEMTVVDLKGLPSGADAAKDGRIVAAMVAKDGMMFFFKMRG